MKNKINNIVLALSLMLVVGFISCSEQNLCVEESDLLGTWRSENLNINGIDATEFIDGSEIILNILGLREDNTYFFNFNSGEWRILDNSVLDLSGTGKLKIISYSDSLFTVEGEIIAAQFFSPLEDFSPDETILLTEDYRRE
ncbi:MAG: hypothetical protein P1U56_05280 [Saprospiraceae bacterium]|nr:hypothetical protein [Saprospiraceae bacterium]